MDVSNQLGCSSWKHLSLVGGEEVISLSHAKVYVFSDSVLCLGKMNQNPTSNTAWERQLDWFKSSSQYRTLDTIGGEPMEFEWNISQDSPHCSSSKKSKSSWAIWANPTNSKDELSSCRCSMTSYGELKTTKRNVLLIPLSLFAKRFPARRWSFLGPGSETKWYSTYNERPQREWDRVPKLMMIKFRESGHPVFRARSTVSRGTLKSKGGGQLSIHFCANGGTIETVFRTIISVNQLGIHGAVSDLCEECKSCHVRTGRPVVAEQSDPHFAPADTQDSWKQLRSDNTSWHKTLTNLCNLQSQWHVVSTLYHEMKNQLTRKVGFEGTPKLGPGWKWQPVICKVNMEWKSELNLWTTTIISHGLNKLSQTWSTKNTTTTSRKPLKRRRKYLRWRRMYLLLQVDQRLKQNHEDLPLLAHLQELYLSVKDFGLILSQELDRISITQCQNDWVLFFVMVIYLKKKMERLNSGD